MAKKFTWLPTRLYLIMLQQTMCYPNLKKWGALFQIFFISKNIQLYPPRGSNIIKSETPGKNPSAFSLFIALPLPDKLAPFGVAQNKTSE